MAIKYIKKGITEADASANQKKTRQIVESILEDVAERGDKAIRELSKKFDNWNPRSFKLSKKKISSLL